MLINLKALGLAVVAAFALSAVVASAASAQTLEAELDGVESGFATATSTDDEFTAGASSVTCNHAEFSGSVASPTKELSITPKYTGCTAFGLTTHVLVTGCVYDFTLKNEHNKTNPITKTSAEVVLDCGASGNHIVLTPTLFGGSHCTITFGTQKVKGALPMTVLTAPTPDDLEVGPESLGGDISYNVLDSGLGCPSEGVHNNGTYHVSATTVEGYSDAAHTKQVGGKLITK